MATEARQLLEERWKTITRDVQRFANEGGLSTVNSKRWIKVDDTLEEFAAMLVDEIDADEGEEDHDSLASLTEGIWTEIHDRMLAWAERVEARRDERRKVAAA